jgi:hypothetical protein
VPAIDSRSPVSSVVNDNARSTSPRANAALIGWALLRVWVPETLQQPSHLRVLVDEAAQSMVPDDGDVQARGHLSGRERAMALRLPPVYIRR